MQQTIVAAATPNAISALAVVRLSGPQAIEIAGRIFRPVSGRPLESLPGYHAAYGSFVTRDEVLDEGIVLVLRAPKSYTGEQMAELSCHGNPAITARLIAACVAEGARPAAAGEFTRRAFENGKIDLVQAEAVAELIESEGRAAAAAALARRDGTLSREIGAVADALSYQAAELAMWADYPEEEDAPAVTREGLEAALDQAKDVLEQLCRGYRSGQMLQNGIAVAIAGSPNVGKSTLLNRLCGEDRSIVTDIAGTTRDVVEGTAELDGVTVRLLDTAGIRQTGDRIEQIGVDRAKRAIETSDLVLFLLDRSRPATEEERLLYQQVKNRPHLVVSNKIDLPEAAGAQIPPFAAVDVEISAETGDGIDRLSEKIRQVLGLNLTQDHCLIASQRQYSCVQRAAEALDGAIAALREGVTLDAVGVLLDEAIEPLAELTGQKVSEAVLAQVFSHFCVGK
ncbi:MAG: tRNA uridine-5-carboxymethylaminomethyl(34) synthesis GTPase MnmE [Oscillospiraceae bacterium]|nr:MAG: tRNA uridine-5-carboxymethylaminomethyl(34) synthesis GTPase MnmE [Oscillospiraceae bacterium]